jgi:hypothetical protein
MRIQVLINPIANNRYQAIGGSPFPFTVEGDTPHEAVQNLRQLIQDRLKAGAGVCSILVPTDENPWIEMAGCYKVDDPMVQEWIEIMAENRRKADENPDFPWEKSNESTGF